MRALTASCPSLSAQERPFRGAASGFGLSYVQVGAFAQHLIDCLKEGHSTEFPAVFAAVDQLLVEDDSGARYLVEHGLIESIQNVAANQGDWAFAARFREWPGPHATIAWDRLHDEWVTWDAGRA
jgi:hypothetical protein